MNILLKYADDTSLLVPSDSDTDLLDEFDNIKGIGTPVERNIQSVDLFFPVRLIVSLIVY